MELKNLFDFRMATLNFLLFRKTNFFADQKTELNRLPYRDIHPGLAILTVLKWFVNVML